METRIYLDIARYLDLVSQSKLDLKLYINTIITNDTDTEVIYTIKISDRSNTIKTIMSRALRDVCSKAYYWLKARDYLED